MRDHPRTVHPMLDPAELDDMRATMAAAMPDEAAVTRPQRTSDGAGGTTSTWQTVATTPCRVGPVSALDERVVGAQVAAQASYTLTVPAGTDVTNADRLVVGARTFEVRAVLRRGEWDLAARVVCTEV